MDDIGSGPARIQDVAALAGVSVATVSNVLNRPERVTAATADRVRSAVQQLDYVPHPGAAGLRSGRASSIGLVLPDISNSFYARIVLGASDAAYERGFALVLCHSGDDPAREQGHFSMLADQRSAGVVVVPLTADHGRLARLRQRGIPLVLADRSMPSSEGCSVAVNDVIGGWMAVQHLVDAGAQDVLMLNGARGIRQCVDRYQGARQAVRGHRGVSLRQQVLPAMSVAAGLEAARALDSVPDAVFCVNDFVAVGFCRGLAERGVSVPGRVRVVGFGDLDVASFAAVPLTTVRQPVEDLGRAAVELLLGEVEARGDHVHQARVFSPELVVRASTTS